MSQINVGKLFGKNIFIGNPKNVKNGEYVICLDGKKPVSFNIKIQGELIPILTKTDAIDALDFENLTILNTYHGDEVEITPSTGYDAIQKVTYNKPKLEEKGTINITENNSTTEVKIGNNFDGLDELTIVVNIPEPEVVEEPNEGNE